MLNSDSIMEFRNLYKARYGKDLGDKEAFEKAHNFLNYMSCLVEFETKERRDATGKANFDDRQ